MASAGVCRAQAARPLLADYHRIGLCLKGLEQEYEKEREREREKFSEPLGCVFSIIVNLWNLLNACEQKQRMSEL